ncbi:DUF6691 family protein [Sphingorhabdus sp. EL138]|uniref:DUF6691 family protein n=1 Tax=Sphingorhabdus sp. EL138 TaxID=2073156 RepID=UPI000D69CE05|nr:DUF6691 family protein [Sphingorhabdus sp. EL138]
MIRFFIALVAGSIFGAGLAYSGMSDPARVQGFLDFFGNWDPTLAFVMGGAIIPMAIAWLVQRRIEKPFADAHFSLPGTQKLDRKLAIGAVLFGAGWGISGLCPGPGLADLAINPLPALVFVAAMLAGMLAHRVTN